MSLNGEKILPREWRWALIGDIVRESQSGFACGERDTDGAIQLRMNNVTTNGTFNWNELTRVPKNIDNLNKFQLLPGDVIFNNTNSTELVGKSALFSGHEETIVYSNHFTRLRVYENQCDGAYLSFWLNNLWFGKVFEDICNRWIGQSAIKLDKLLSLKIPLPPLPEQKRITAILTERLAAVEGGRKASEARLEAARALPAAYLREVFESEEARGWPEVLLGDVLLCIEAGKSFQTGEIQACEDELGVLKVSAVTWSSFKPDEAKVVNDYEPESHHRVCNGDLLISRANTKELVGAAVLVNKDYPLRLLSDKTLRLVVDPEQADKLYLLHSLRSSPARKHIEHFATGTSDSMRNISQGVIKSTPIRLPDLNTQRRIAGYFYTKNKSADDASIAIQEQLIEIKRLASSLLRQAFSGAL